jgi:cytochrome d ubiquinol oxidase subunit II
MPGAARFSRAGANGKGDDMEWYLPLIWAAVIGIAVAMYIIMDGFDLGIGILFPFAKNETERDQMMRSIAPFWDGNETWLVLGGAGLFVAFPRAYAVIMPALYLPVIVMLLALVFRGIAFEFRTVSHSKKGWSFAFVVGSTLAGFAQGVILGGMIQGIKVENGAYAGGSFDWATPFALVCGLALIAGYGLLGATWLVMKTEGAIAVRARRQSKLFLVIVLAFMAAVSLWTPLAEPRIAARWFSLPNFYFLWPVPAVTALVAFACWHWIDKGRDAPPFLAAIALFMLGYLGLVISNFPFLAPPSLTIWDTAAAPASQIFMLFGTLLLLPFVLGYIVLVYWLFRGKVREGESYH